MVRQATETVPKRAGVLPSAAAAPVLAPPLDAPSLERELAAAEGGPAWLRKLAVWGLLLLLVAGAVAWRVKTRPPPQPRYVVASVSQGDVLETVQSTGTVQPLTQVQVGAQISGRIVKVFVDFNSIVKKGDVLAEIDPMLLSASVEQNRAQLAAADAQLARANASLTASQAALERIQLLHRENLASQADEDLARGQRDVASADVAAAKAQIVQTRAQLAYSQTNMAYARIYAPIDGLVVSRNVDPGQTVAASLAAPTMFVIAQDLREMRVLAEIDEADVGKLKEGMGAEATVDAFAGEVFRGTVSQVRYNPNSVQGVVTYLGVIDIQNPDMKLRPGMTATVTVKTREAKDVLRVSNAALRYKPTPPAKDSSNNNVAKEPETRSEPLGTGKGRVYLIADNTPGSERAEPKVVAIGITDGVNTELKTAELPAGSRVVIDETDQDDPKKRGPRLF